MANQACDKKPVGYVTLSQHSVDVVYEGGREESIVRYYGRAEDLIAAGVATAEMLLPGRRSRRDADGDRCSVQRYWRNGDNGQPYRHCRLSRFKSVKSIERLPGVLDARNAADGLNRWREEHHARLLEGRAEMLTESAPQPRPQLRLVVDNTREVHHG